MKKIYSIRNIIVSFIALITLIWAFFKNTFFGKIVILPFMICSFAMLFENIFLLLNKIKISNLFKYLFRISFFVYVLGFLLYMVHYAIANKTYSILIIVAIFLLITIYFMKKSFFNNK